MSNEKGYNGYTNYETWAVSLWLDNDESTQDYWSNMAEDYFNQNDDTEDAKYALMNALKAEIEENSPLNEASMYSDLLDAALSEINYYEIAENYINEVKGNQEA